MVNVSVVIVNYNTYDLVKECIRSIYELTKDIIFEIIVIDNNSPDRSIDKISTDYPAVVLIKSLINGGFGYANNLGAKKAQGQYLFLLNSDTVLRNNAIKILYDFIYERKDVGICGGNLFSPQLKPDFSFYQMLPSPKTELDNLFTNFFSKRKYKNNLSFNYSELPLEIDGFISGADLMISANLFKKLDGFNEKYFMYYEDTDLNLRVRKLGYKIYSVSTAKIIHYNGGSQTKTRTVQSQWMKDSRRLFYKSNAIRGYYLSLFFRGLSLVKSLIGNILLFRIEQARNNIVALKML